MKKSVIFTILLVITSVAMFSCDDDKEKTLVSIVVTTPPSKTIYTVGEVFDPAGMVVTATFSNGDTETINSSSLTITDGNFSEAGARTVTIAFTYEGTTVSTTVSVTVNAPPAKTVSVGTQAGTLTAGEAGTVTFPVTTANIANGSYAATVANRPTGVTVQGQVTIANNSGTLTLAGDATTTAGTTNNLTLSIDGTTSVVFTLSIEAAEVTLVSIAVTTQPAKKEYEVGEVFDPAGMVVTATYSDNSTAPVTVIEDMLEYDFSEAGEDITVTITYEGKTATVMVTVITAPEKTITVYAQSETLVAGTEGAVSFQFSVTNIAQGTYAAAVANLPVGVSVQGDVEIRTFFNTMTLVGNTSTVAGTTTTLTLTIDGATSEEFTLTISEPAFSGKGTSGDPYLIGTAAELARLAELVNSSNTRGTYNNRYYKLTADINISAYGSGWNWGWGWEPIGNSFLNSFDGHFDGNNHKVTGLYIRLTDGNSSDYMGLFGYIQNGSVRSLGVEGEVSGRDFVGGLAGLVNGGNIIGSYFNGTVSGRNNVGGLAGTIQYSNSGSIVTNSYSTGSVSGVNNNIGGLVGSVANSIVSNSFSSSAVSGGVAGGIAGRLSARGEVINCYAIGAVSGDEYVGGIAGHFENLGKIINCYAAGAVSVNNPSTTVGGIGGHGADLTYCAALNPSVIGFRIGYNFQGILPNNLAWQGMLVNGNTITGSRNGLNGADITTTQAITQATYSGTGTDQLRWKFGNDDDNPWKWVGGSYPLPVLYWQETYPTLPEHLK